MSKAPRRKIALIENVRVALRAIRNNKLRAGLTSLGIIIGVATVIAMMTVVGGINDIVVKEFSRIGANVFTLQRFPSISISFDWKKFHLRKDLTMQDAEAIKRSCPSVDLVSPMVYRWRGETIRANRRKTDPNVAIAATTETYLAVAGMTLDFGRNFTKREIDGGARVCILGYDVVERLFPYGSPIGRDVTMRGDRYRVVGLTERLGTMFGESRDNYIAIPMGAYLRRWDIDDFLQISIKAKSGVALEAAIDEVRALMRVRHKLKLTQPDDFELETRDSLMNSYASLTGSVFFAAIGIAMISLLVGGIGIMNIMLVSVRERTREIGVRKAMGARRRDIARQFLIEAVTLSSLGGLVGVALGVGGLMLASHFTDKLPVAFSAGSIVLAVLFSTFVGVFFGVYPARRAAALDPIESLRYE
jgi:putative ABC transport system permease protein